MEDIDAAVREMQHLEYASKVASGVAKQQPEAPTQEEVEATPPHHSELYPSQTPAFSPDLAGTSKPPAMRQHAQDKRWIKLVYCQLPLLMALQLAFGHDYFLWSMALGMQFPHAEASSVNLGSAPFY